MSDRNWARLGAAGGAAFVLLSLIGNAFNILNVNPFFKDLTTGLIIVVAVALSAVGMTTLTGRRRMRPTV